jgi:hypothetical protein
MQILDSRIPDHDSGTSDYDSLTLDDDSPTRDYDSAIADHDFPILDYDPTTGEDGTTTVDCDFAFQTFGSVIPVLLWKSRRLRPE